MDGGFCWTSPCFPCFSGLVLFIILIVSVVVPEKRLFRTCLGMTRGTSVTERHLTRDGGGVFLMFFGGLRGI